MRLQNLPLKNKQVLSLNCLVSNALWAVCSALSGCLGGRSAEPLCCAITSGAELSGSGALNALMGRAQAVGGLHPT